MASAIQLSYCGPCGYDDVTKEAKRWCTNCKEGLCGDCEKAHIKNKISRNHKVIAIEDYRKIDNISISEVCEHHGENLEWFCKTHDNALCMVCVPSNHKSCSDVISIHVASNNANQSTALFDLVESIDGLLCNVKQCITNRDSATKEIEKQELEIKKMILQTRTKVNNHLDKLEEKLLLELGSTSRSCKSEYAKILQKLKSVEETLTKLREQTLHIKQFSSDIQVFLGTYHGNKLIVTETKAIKDAIDASKDYELIVDLNSLTKKLLKEVQDFGKIKVTEYISQLNFKDPKIEQAQKGITVPSSRNISNKQLQLIKTFGIAMVEHNFDMHITSCVILSNGHLLMAYFAQKYLIEFNATGEHIRDMPVSSNPFAIAVIDDNRIVVSCDKGLEIMNNNTFHVEKTISLRDICWGVSHEDGKLYVVSGYDKRHVIDLSGKQQGAIGIASSNVLQVTTSTDRIFYTDDCTNIIHCCLMNGDELWQFQSESIRCPYGLSVDTNHNVYVIGYKSNNLTIIQHDGKESRTLLTESDGLNSPQALYYNNEKRTLLIVNTVGTASLYSVV